MNWQILLLILSRFQIFRTLNVVPRIHLIENHVLIIALVPVVILFWGLIHHLLGCFASCSCLWFLNFYSKPFQILRMEQDVGQLTFENIIFCFLELLISNITWWNILILAKLPIWIIKFVALWCCSFCYFIGLPRCDIISWSRWYQCWIWLHILLILLRPWRHLRTLMILSKSTSCQKLRHINFLLFMHWWT